MLFIMLYKAVLTSASVAAIHSYFWSYGGVLSYGALIMLYKAILTFDSVDEILKCDHSNERYWAVLSCGAVYHAVQGGSNFWVPGWNRKVWPFKSQLLSSTFLWYCLLCSKWCTVASVNKIQVAKLLSRLSCGAGPGCLRKPVNWLTRINPDLTKVLWMFTCFVVKARRRNKARVLVPLRVVERVAPRQFLFLLIKRVFKANFNSSLENNQIQNVEQKRFTEMLIAWL